MRWNEFLLTKIIYWKRIGFRLLVFIVLDKKHFHSIAMHYNVMANSDLFVVSTFEF